MSDVPPEVIADIFSRLPVKSLLRFRSVSKPFRALIDSPEFIKSHLNQSLITNTHRSIIIRYSYLYSIDFDSLDRAILLNHPLKTPKFGTEVLGSCDGLLCLYNSEEDIVLWNPSTRRHQKLPISAIEFPGDSSAFTVCEKIIYGFGYDHVNDDYKVVRIVQFWDEVVNEVKVYSLKSNSWRRIKDFPYYLSYKRAHGMLVNGALHWVVTPRFDSEDVKLIASFNLETEEYQLVPQPEYSEKNFHVNVGELGGSLCVLCNYYLSYIDIWVMNIYGVKDSWVKLISIAQPNDIRSFEYPRPIAYSKSGDQVLLEQEGGKLLWYDLKSKTVKNIRIPGMAKFSEAFVCVGSLVKLTGGRTDATQEKSKKKEKKTLKKRDDFLSKGFKLAL